MDETEKSSIAAWLVGGEMKKWNATIIIQNIRSSSCETVIISDLSVAYSRGFQSFRCHIPTNMIILM